MEQEKSLSQLIKERIEAGESREKIISNLILEGYRFQEIQAALEAMKERNELPADFWLEGQKKKKWATFRPWGKYKKIEEKLEEDNLYPLEKKPASLFSKRWFWITFLSLLGVGAALIGVWYFFFWQSPLAILQRSLVSLSRVNSLGFQSSFLFKISDFNLNQDEYLKNLFKDFNQESGIRVNLEGSLNAFEASSLKRAFWIKFFDNQGKNIWSADFIQINPNEFYLLTNFYLDNQKEKISSFPQSHWLNLAESGSSSAFQQFLPVDIFRNSLSFYSFNNSDTLLHLKERLMNLSLSKEDFQVLEKVSSAGSFYQIRIHPQPDLNRRIFSILENLISFGGWFKENQLIQASWELWIGKNDLLPYQINVFLDQTNQPAIQIKLEKFNYPFDISRPSSLLLPEEMLEIIQDSLEESNN
ncbi:MAG: hypothetical protein KatS3mg098_241 [Candidatus Parcubacteria bacterium]|nr:hypothetical protein [Patescibacteria group bacterium]BCX16012.1 MAG: hypothetical protein KatS3mg098_241 [Candidatus Parcubacteria bacterium]